MEHLAPINMHAAAEEVALPLPGTMLDKSALPRMRDAVPMAEGSALSRMRGAVPHPGKMSGESDLLTMRVAEAPPEKAMPEAFRAIAGMAERLGIAASVRDRAQDVFKRMEDAKGKGHHYYTKGGGRSGDALYAACLYIACRSAGAPRTFKELAAATRDGAAARKDIGKLITLIRKRLGDEAGGQAMDIGVVRAADYMERFGSLLGVGEDDVRAAQEAARRMQERLDVRRNPDSTAAAIIYMAMERRDGAGRCLRDVSVATGVAENTIKQAYRELCPHADLLFGSSACQGCAGGSLARTDIR
ncbi:transcription initiation factor IIB-like [Phragmites australis]|uniref:transcription initiation factor IIB-like n=1 Tax=Phragmites australis TaxID=29695 RepID=UPI002D7846EB|nr:transcription initiation factor IIB-like [Phragmites australis]